MEDQVIWSKKAESYLERTFKFIAEDSEVYARRFVTSLILHTENHFRQEIAPGRNVPEFKNTQLAFLKEIIYKGYRIIYDDSFEKNKIYVVLCY